MIIGIVGSFLMNQSFDLEILVIVGLVYLIAFIFGSLIIPLIYKFGTENSIDAVSLCPDSNGPVSIAGTVQCPSPTTGNPWIYLFLLIVFAVVGVVLSYLISLKIYTKKSFRKK